MLLEMRLFDFLFLFLFFWERSRIGRYHNFLIMHSFGCFVFLRLRRI